MTSTTSAPVASKRPPAAVVIVPLFNREELVRRTLDSIRAQSWRPLRVVVVDNNSTDRSREVASRWASENTTEDFIVEVCSESRQGAAAARRRGVEATAGSMKDDDVLFFFDSDDTMRPEMVETVMREFVADSSLELVSWPIVIHELDGSLRVPPGARSGKETEMHLVHAVYSTQRVAVRRRFHLDSGGWAPDVMVWDDWELGARYCLKNPRSAIVPEPLADTFCQAQSITGTDFSSKAGRWEEILDMVESYSADSHWRALIAYRRAILAAHYRREGREDLAAPLLAEALSYPALTALQRLILRGVYRYTAAGLRGAYRLVAPFL